MEVFNPIYNGKTTKGEMNFIGAAIAFFDDINGEYLEETKDAYIRNYNKNIFPYVDVNRAMADYDEDVIKELIDVITNEETTLSAQTINCRAAN